MRCTVLRGWGLGCKAVCLRVYVPRCVYPLQASLTEPVGGGAGAGCMSMEDLDGPGKGAA